MIEKVVSQGPKRGLLHFSKSCKNLLKFVKKHMLPDTIIKANPQTGIRQLPKSIAPEGVNDALGRLREITKKHAAGHRYKGESPKRGSPHIS